MIKKETRAQASCKQWHYHCGHTRLHIKHNSCASLWIHAYDKHTHTHKTLFSLFTHRHTCIWPLFSFQIQWCFLHICQDIAMMSGLTLYLFLPHESYQALLARPSRITSYMRYLPLKSKSKHWTNTCKWIFHYGHTPNQGVGLWNSSDILFFKTCHNSLSSTANLTPNTI